MRITATLAGHRALLRRLEKVGILTAAVAARESMIAVAQKIAITARKLAPKAFNDLVSSIVVESGASWAIVLVKSPHGAYVEFGTKPHWPPLEAVRAWALMKGMNPAVLALHISRHGTPAQPFLTPAWEQHVDELPVIYRGRVSKIWGKL